MIKKQLCLFGSAVALGAVALAGTNVFAEDRSNITTTEGLKDCITQTTSSTCTLGGDIEWSELVNIDSDITLDLNGHKITSDTIAKFFQVKSSTLNIVGNGEITTTDTTNTGVIRVYGSATKEGAPTKVSVGKDVTINGVNPIVIYNTGVTAYNTTVDVYGTLIGKNSGVWMIGTISDTDNYPIVNIHDGAVLKADGVEGIGLSAMGYAKYNIGKATITGVGSGIGIKAGIINIDGATVTGTGNIDEKNLPPEPYGDGMNPSGAAIQIEGHHGYAGAIELNINSGTFKSEHDYAFYGNKEAEVEEGEVFKSLTIKSGTFVGEKGTINENHLELPAERIAAGSAITKDSTNEYVVTADVLDIKGLTEDQSVVVEMKSKLTTEEASLVEAFKAENPKIKDSKIAGIFDIAVLEDGEIISETENEITFTVKIDGNLKAEDGYTRSWYVLQIHNGEVKLIDGVVDEEKGTVTFTADKFSTYILSYIETKNSNIVSPDSGTFTKNSDSVNENGMLAGIIAGAVTVLGIVFAIVKRTVKK